MLIIPALDLKGGKLVRLEQGNFAKVTVYSENPLEIAIRWESEGAELLHIVDLDGAFEGIPKNLDLLKKIVKSIKIPVQAGGGIRTAEKIKELLNAGVKRVVIGTKACEEITWLKEVLRDFSGRVVVSLDVKEDFLATEGWIKKTSLKPQRLVKELTRLGVDTFIFTDIERDGTLKGLRVDYLAHFLAQTKIKIMVAGGVRSLEDIKVLKSLSPQGVVGVIVGKALYEKRFTLKEAMEIAK
ncbi:MAG: 1-(5-phosphoribosyl)-5-[(5-phosphoribosylamino)methylideneamino]imidazole-4-carboxamide isomerase [Candidatus Omnitrophica bacterium]|nr:1-(5-phosphoribosyl)-5-[(5-phosphoribosylamino)methylideneamino]imidazole-4-carboxamide isomerase [Candidatus Omnitrophota bacterium]